MSFKKIDNIPVWGPPDKGAVKQIKNCVKHSSAVAGALMGDHHLGYSMPIGGVVVYRDKISPSGVGYDQCCGNKAVRLDIPANEVRENIKNIMDVVWGNISFGIGMKNKEEVNHELFDDDPAWEIKVAADMKDKSRTQLGTVGSGNHYVDIFVDEQDRVWVGVHFGSRGLGHKTATYFIKEGGGHDGIDAPPVLLDVNTQIGQDYIACMKLAGRYAYAGRDWVCQRVAKILEANILEEVHNNHNFADEEEHFGEKVWVHRKGATPAYPGQKGFVGGSMGDVSVIVEGVDHKDSDLAIRSTVHGAGRVMSRTKAAGKKRWSKEKKCFVRKTEGEISREMMMEWIGKLGVELRGGGTDESPHCYKRLPEVLDAHRNTIKILHTLTPLGVAMAGADEYDPYKD